MKQTTKQLIETLSEISKAIQDGDSFEGHISYSCLEEHLERDEWEVSGAYRIGNNMGQGGMRVMEPSEEAINFEE